MFLSDFRAKMIKTAFLNTVLLMTNFAFAQGRVVELVIENHKFNIEKIEMKSDEKIKIVIKNKDPNFEEFESRSLVIEKFLKPGSQISVSIGPLKPGEYDYFADFHSSTGKGKIVVTP